MTIAGEVLDATAVFSAAAKEGPVLYVASSFAAVSLCRMPVSWHQHLLGLALLNPVLSIRRTFLEPELSWQKRNFGRDRMESALSTGRLLIDGRFALGGPLLRELLSGDGDFSFRTFVCPVLIIHGDQDTFTSYAESLRLSRSLRERARFVPVVGAEHGFHRPHETSLIAAQIVKFALMLMPTR